MVRLTKLYFNIDKYSMWTMINLIVVKNLFNPLAQLRMV